MLMPWALQPISSCPTGFYAISGHGLDPPSNTSCTQAPCPSRPEDLIFEATPHTSNPRPSGRPRPLSQIALKGWVDEHHIHRCFGQVAQSLNAVDLVQHQPLGFEAHDVLLDGLTQDPVQFKQMNRCRSSRSTLQTQNASPCKHIHTAPSTQILSQPIEQGLTHSVWCGPQPFTVQHLDLGAPPTSTNDAQFMCTQG